MDYDIEEEYKYFIEEIRNSNFEIGHYLDETNYEDEYSHDDIHKAMKILADKIRVYLHENYPKKFIVSTGWCVHVMTPERARHSRISERTIENNLVV